ncbi:uncharacterized protein LOC133200955 [Saccostrea echinata]|uniref:uncharacterized protein LOC133200955 n=1 Tax=Saccostrea echinata TaxID=191078 RepID=UPI002A823804|nr:uncharacterized protein LOC133200955 [Saccostrea echinata]
MATGKTRQISVTRAQKLPPIREETFSSRGGSARISVRPAAKYEVLRTSNDPPKPRPTVHARPLPADRSQSPKERKSPRYQSPRSQAPPRPNLYMPLTPVDTTNTLVDGLVADYLHFAQYGHIIPLYEGSSNLTCPCCTDRNRENVRTLLGFPSTEKSKVGHRHTNDSKYGGSLSNDFSTGNHTKNYEPVYGGSLSDRTLVGGDRHRSMDRTWMNYQPLVHASNYLNPEFSRPSVLYNYNVNQTSADDEHVRSQVLSADKQYELSMAKLEKYGF